MKTNANYKKNGQLPTACAEAPQKPEAKYGEVLLRIGIRCVCELKNKCT